MQKIAVVIPCYKVKDHIIEVLSHIGDDVCKIYCVDDACPEGSGVFITQNTNDPRIEVITHDVNKGVGGATMTGYQKAAADGMDIAVKIDGDGQMDPQLIAHFTQPIADNICDYTKGNRFYRIEDIQHMPKIRVFGNAVLSFMTKISSGYWNLFDPTNGYTAISCKLIPFLPLEKVNNRYFFESDLLFRLNTMRCVVQDIPMQAVYGDEESNLSVKKIIGPFLKGHTKNFAKRIFYNYFLRDFSVASIELVLGSFMLLFGCVWSASKWYASVSSGEVSSAGTVMIGMLFILVGTQLLLSALHYDQRNIPDTPIHKRLPGQKPKN
tara:strand:+ start:2565 stop:3536 length:972 start_codon:yes stop_codon:yes gene_type:complete